MRSLVVPTFDYTDVNGSHTKRMVDVRKIGPAQYGNLIMGMCKLRGEYRTFRADRMKHCIDLANGNPIVDPYQSLMYKYELSPDRSAEKLLDEEFDTLRTLLYVGKADGYLRAAEKTVIRRTCKVLAADSRLTDESIDRLFKELEVPSIHAFKMAVGRLSAKDAAARTALLDAATEIVATQKTVHHAEQEAMDYLNQKFKITSTA